MLLSLLVSLDGSHTTTQWPSCKSGSKWTVVILKCNYCSGLTVCIRTCVPNVIISPLVLFPSLTPVLNRCSKVMNTTNSTTWYLVVILNRQWIVTSWWVFVGFEFGTQKAELAWKCFGYSHCSTILLLWVGICWNLLWKGWKTKLNFTRVWTPCVGS